MDKLRYNVVLAIFGLCCSLGIAWAEITSINATSASGNILPVEQQPLISQSGFTILGNND